MRTLFLILCLSLLGCDGEYADSWDGYDSGLEETDGGLESDSSVDSGSDASDIDTDSDTDSDTDVDSDTDTDIDSDTDTDTDSDSDTGTGSDTDIPADCIGPGVHLDPTSAWCWERSSPTAMVNHSAAQAYCGALTLDGATDWRLPTITELQDIAECYPAMGCGVDSGCLSPDCEDTCSTCSLMGGPASDGCYWDDAIYSGQCSLYWSSSQVTAVSNTAYWRFNFSSGDYSPIVTAGVGHVRCIRIP